MKLQKFPIFAIAFLVVAPADLWAHGGFGGARGGGGGGGGAVARSFAGARGFAGARSAGIVRGPGFVGAGRFGGRPAMVGERFQRFDHRRFDHRRGFNTVVIAGGGYAYPYAYYGGYDYSGYPGRPYSEAVYPGTYADYSGPVPDVSPGLVAGDVVGNVQRVLRYRGFYRGPIDGLSGPATRAAIRAYDASVGLPPTGMIDARLLLSMQLM